jgi:nickel superoxide dismutase
MRFEIIAEHIKTLEKSMQQIQELQKKADPDSNQLVRWIMNKESHADRLCDVITQYFMKQRIKPVADEQSPEYPGYTRQLVLLHKMMIHSMHCKQTTDLDNITILRESLDQFRKLYFGEEASASEPHEHPHP